MMRNGRNMMDDAIAPPFRVNMTVGTLPVLVVTPNCL
jgi:hypothetical protein